MSLAKLPHVEGRATRQPWKGTFHGAPTGGNSITKVWGSLSSAHTLTMCVSLVAFEAQTWVGRTNTFHHGPTCATNCRCQSSSSEFSPSGSKSKHRARNLVSTHLRKCQTDARTPQHTQTLTPTMMTTRCRRQHSRNAYNHKCACSRPPWCFQSCSGVGDGRS